MPAKTKFEGPRPAAVEELPQILALLNHEMLSEELHEDPFVTMAYGTINVQTYELQYGLAGHPPAILQHADGRQELLDASGPLLGVMDEPYPTAAIHLAPGDKVVF